MDSGWILDEVFLGGQLVVFVDDHVRVGGSVRDDLVACPVILL